MKTKVVNGQTLTLIEGSSGNAFSSAMPEEEFLQMVKDEREKLKEENLKETARSSAGDVWALNPDAQAKAGWRYEYTNLGNGVRYTTIALHFAATNYPNKPPIGAVSLVMDLAPQMSTPQFNAFFLNNGYMFWNQNPETGKYYFSWFSLTLFPMSYSAWDIITFQVFNVNADIPLLFDTSYVEYCDIGIDGISSYTTNWENGLIPKHI